MKNVHVRHLAAPIERVSPWIAGCWSGGDRDCFPRDVIQSWRANPPELAADALVPGQTMMGHGPFRFRLRQWDGLTWRVDVVGDLDGWHGFDLAPAGDGTRLTHTLELAPGWRAWLAWKAIEHVHDWAVEAMFDRIADALIAGRPPARTVRPLSTRAALALAVARRRHRGGGRGQPRAAVPVTSPAATAAPAADACRPPPG